MRETPATDSRSFDLTGHLLIAMPGMGDDRFARSVVLICSHTAEGSMGFVLNQSLASPKFPEILAELGLDKEAANLDKEERGRNTCVYPPRPLASVERIFLPGAAT